MHTFAGAPSADELKALRQSAMALVKPATGLPLATLAALGNTVPPGVGVTVQPAAEDDAAVPLVVVWAPGDNLALLERLSAREREVARLVAAGRRNKEIAATLFISEATVKDHVHHILQKCELSSRSELAQALSRH